MVVPPNQITPASQFEDSVQANVEDNVHVDLQVVQAGAENEQEDKLLSETVKLLSETVDDKSGRVVTEEN
jgi:hypothetical protein